MSYAEEYRERARDAERDAQQMSRLDEREAMLKIAKSWRDLADREDRRDAANRNGL